MKLKIGLVQMSSGGDKGINLAAAAAAIKGLAEQGADLVMLPEHFNFMGDDEGRRQQAERVENSPSLEAIREQAQAYRVHVHLGSFLEECDGRLYNTGIVVDPQGNLVARYRKIHLFDVEIPGGKQYLESNLITPGSEIVTFTVGGFVFGMATCYDLRFPELFRQLVDRGAHVLLLPAAFTLQTGRDHWQVLLQARAIENQCWVAAVGQWGALPPDHTCFGRSMVINPWGLVVAQATDGTTTLLADLDIAELQAIRTNFPALKHRRKDLFGG